MRKTRNEIQYLISNIFTQMCELTVCAQNLENYIDSRNDMMVFPPIYFIDKHMIIPNLT
jgi:hypothetical protein